MELLELAKEPLRNYQPYYFEFMTISGLLVKGTHMLVKRKRDPPEPPLLIPLRRLKDYILIFGKDFNESFEFSSIRFKFSSDIATDDIIKVYTLEDAAKVIEMCFEVYLN